MYGNSVCLIGVVVHYGGLVLKVLGYYFCRLILWISSVYINTISIKENKREGETELWWWRILGPISTCQAQLVFEFLDLFNLYWHSFYQEELEGGRNWSYHGEGFQGPSAPAKPSVWGSWSHQLILTQFLSGRIRRRKKLKLSWWGILELISTCQAQPAFESLNFINLYWHSFS